MEELIRAFYDLGIPLDKMEATNLLQRYFKLCRLLFFYNYSFFVFVVVLFLSLPLVCTLTRFLFLNYQLLSCRMDQDGSLNISYDEWRDFLLLAPSHDIQSLILYWRHSTVSEFITHFHFDVVARKNESQSVTCCLFLHALFCWRICCFFFHHTDGQLAEMICFGRAPNDYPIKSEGFTTRLEANGYFLSLIVGVMGVVHHMTLRARCKA